MTPPFNGAVDGLDVVIHAKDTAEKASFLLDLEALAWEAGMTYTTTTPTNTTTESVAYTHPLLSHT